MMNNMEIKMLERMTDAFEDNLGAILIGVIIGMIFMGLIS